MKRVLTWRVLAVAVVILVVAVAACAKATPTPTPRPTATPTPTQVATPTSTAPVATPTPTGGFTYTPTHPLGKVTYALTTVAPVCGERPQCPCWATDGSHMGVVEPLFRDGDQGVMTPWPASGWAIRVRPSFWCILVLLGLFSWVGFVRVVRAHTLSVKSMDFISLARIAGASHLRIIVQHIAPMVLSSAVVVATLSVGDLILLEATLSFIGAGNPAPNPAWGTIIAEGRNYISTFWWQAFFPGAAIFLVVMSLNFLGDWLRDRLDPRLRQI